MELYLQSRIRVDFSRADVGACVTLPTSDDKAFPHHASRMFVEYTKEGREGGGGGFSALRLRLRILHKRRDIFLHDDLSN
jgi:hypothetical protein